MCFLYEKPNFWLVTNWHVLSGRNASDPTKVLHTKGSLPNRLRLSLILKPDQPEYTIPQEPEPQFLKQEQTIELYHQNGAATWYQHPMKNICDVGVLNASPFVGRFLINGINQIAQQNDMAIQTGNPIFILGYPLGFSHFIDTPIWKSGCIASEPHLETTEETGLSGGRVVIDATTRQGMSGAPVIMREKTHYLAENGEIKQHANATRWIGVYASRPNIPAAQVGPPDEDRRAEIGYLYKSGAVQRTIADGIRGPNFDELP
jgi:Trypsin-like peptidase domain